MTYFSNAENQERYRRIAGENTEDEAVIRAFLAAMWDREYGDEEALDAFLWFHGGWTSHQAEVGIR